MTIDIRPAITSRERRQFLTFPWRVYRDDPLWVPPLLPELTKRIDPEWSAWFTHGTAELFIAWRDGRPVGTICAAEDYHANRSRQPPECVFGFFEYIQDYEVFQVLVQHAIEWARQRGLGTLRGPFNLDYEDSYGVLLKGRDRPPAIFCGHTPVYYQHFMERYGFQPARADNLAYWFDINLDAPAIKRLLRLDERVRRRGTITVRGADIDSWDAEVDRVYRLINIALAHLPDHTDWPRESLEALLTPFRQIADPELVLFAEVDGETVGWLPAIANLNEALIHANGLRYPWDYVRAWWHTRRQPSSLGIKSVLIPPEYWGTGVSVVLFAEMARRAKAKGFEWTDLSITSEDNPNTPILAERMGARVYKRYRVYRLDVRPGAGTST
jgi:GNAT superfamily N-acetyltransferase